MKEKTKVLVTVITIIALILTAAVLVTVLVIKTKNELENRWESRYEDRAEEGKDENEEEAIEQAPETEAPAAMEETAYRLGLVLMHDPIFADIVAEQFAEHCGDLGYTSDVWVTTSDDPEEVYEISMELIASGVDGLAVSCWDTDCVREINEVARASEVLFVNLETPYTEENAAVECLAVQAYSRPLQQVPFLFGFMEQDLGGRGSFGVVKCGDNDPVYDALTVIYPGMEGMDNLWWSADAYTDGSEESNREALYFLLEENDLDAIVCTDPVVSLLAVQMIEELGKDIYIYGFGPPSMVLGCSYDGLMFYHDIAALSECLVYTMDRVLSGPPMENGGTMKVPSGKTYYTWQTDGYYKMTVPGLAYSDRNIENLAQIYG